MGGSTINFWDFSLPFRLLPLTISSKSQKPHLAETVEQCVVLLRVSKATQI